MTESLLVMEGIHFPSFSIRGCVQELAPLQKSNLFKRTINGDLVYLGEGMDQKYISKITCADEVLPEMAHLWQGNIVKVHCITPLAQPINHGVCTLSKQVVPGSLVVKDREGSSLEYTTEGGEVLSIYQRPGVVSYRPLLTMAITHFSYRFDEWGGKVGWHIELEEV